MVLTRRGFQVSEQDRELLTCFADNLLNRTLTYFSRHACLVEGCLLQPSAKEIYPLPGS